LQLEVAYLLPVLPAKCSPDGILEYDRVIVDTIRVC
jgi:hypothetical protein